MTDDLRDAVAVYRLTRLLVEDGILDRPRFALQDWLKDNDHPKLEELTDCYWCMSIWIGAAVLLIRARFPRAWKPVSWVLAASALTGVIAEKGSDA